MLERIAAPPTGALHGQRTADSNRTRFNNPLRLRGRGAAEAIPLCQDVPIIPLYRFGPILRMNLVMPQFMVIPVQER